MPKNYNHKVANPVKEEKGWQLRVFHQHSKEHRETITVAIRINEEVGFMNADFFKAIWGKEDYQFDVGMPLCSINIDMQACDGPPPVNEETVECLLEQVIHQHEQLQFNQSMGEDDDKG